MRKKNKSSKDRLLERLIQVKKTEKRTKIVTDNQKIEQEKMDEILFTSGKNVLKIILQKENKRKFTIKFELNDLIVKPSIHATENNAKSFWDMMKGGLK